jgi:peptidoglycan/LPS O-acetylase OafA/YrhL
MCVWQSPTQWTILSEIGSTGVSLFFVLSGYLITRLLIREEKKFGDINLTLFFGRRALRLFPALWTYLIVIIILTIAKQIPNEGWHSVIAGFIYIRNIVGRGHETAHLWSLSLEEQFYIVWPFLFLFSKNRPVLRTLLVCAPIILIPIWRYVADAYNLVSNQGVFYMRTDFRMDSPCYGCLLALLESSQIQRLTSLFQSPRFQFTAASIGFIGIFVWSGYRGSEQSLGALNHSIGSILGFLILAGLIKAPRYNFSWLHFTPLVYLGQISYSIYLWQQLFIGPATSLETVRSSTFLALFCPILMAVVSWHGFEKRFISLKDTYLQRNMLPATSP